MIQVTQQSFFLTLMEVLRIQYNFGDFIDSMLTNLNTAPVPSYLNDQWCLMLNNLSIHKTIYVTDIIHGWDSNNHFSTMNRSPYRPKILPNFIFWGLVVELERRFQPDWTIGSLPFHIYDNCSMIGMIGKCHSTFTGYTH